MSGWDMPAPGCSTEGRPQAAAVRKKRAQSCRCVVVRACPRSSTQRAACCSRARQRQLADQAPDGAQNRVWWPPVDSREALRPCPLKDSMASTAGKRQRRPTEKASGSSRSGSLAAASQPDAADPWAAGKIANLTKQAGRRRPGRPRKGATLLVSLPPSYLCVCVSVCLCVYVSVCLCVCLSVCVSVCQSRS